MALALSGCVTGPEFNPGTGPVMAPAPLPRYTVGESFTYNDNRTDTVISVKDDLVTWRTERGDIINQFNNFLVPSISWRTRTRRSVATITGTPEKLWPLKVGNNQRFNIVQTITRTNAPSIQELSRTWHCAVEGTKTITVPAGTFNTFRIACYRYLLDSRSWRQTRTYYFAPVIGHYVARDDIYASGPSKRRALVSAGFDSRALSNPDQASLGQALQDTLSRNRDGAALNWKSADGNVTATLTPTRTFKGLNAITCRDYLSMYQYGGHKRTNTKRACRQPNGQWQRVAITIKN